MLQLPESGRHDEVLQSVVAHNARRRAQRHRAERNRRLARISGKVGLAAACGVGIYLLFLGASSLFGGSKTNEPAAAAKPPAATVAAPAAKPKATPKPVQHHTVTATKVTAKTKTHVKAKRPVTATIASIPPAAHHTTKTTTTPKKAPAKHATPSQQSVVLAESDAAKGTRTTELEATLPTPGMATFTIAATRGPAFVEIRLLTHTGPLLSKGTIPKGETISFTNKVLWVEVDSLQNLDLSVNGKPWRPSGSTVVATLTPTS